MVAWEQKGVGNRNVCEGLHLVKRKLFMVLYKTVLWRWFHTYVKKYICVYICQNWSYFTLNVFSLLCVTYTSIQLLKIKLN